MTGHIGFFKYAANCFWLIVPPMGMNWALWDRLPKTYQAEVFDRGIPLWIRVGENLFRTVVMTLPIVMILSFSTRTRRSGLVIYGIGFVLYGLSWAAQIYYPRSRWSLSAWGFMAPSYTPLVWLSAIGLIGSTWFVAVPWSSWGYIAFVVVFLLFHNTHAWIVYNRNR